MADLPSPVQFQILGPLSATSADGESLHFGSTTQRRLITALALHANSVVPSDQLGDWCDLSGGALRTAISRLRKIVGADTIQRQPPGYMLCANTVGSIDLQYFEELMAEPRSARPAEALVQLDRALELWSGDALADFADEPWAQASASALSELRASAIEERAETLLRLGRWADAIVAMERHTARYPLRDRPRGLLMRALAGAGRQPEALRAYQAYRDYLGEEIGTEPTDEVRALEAKIATGWRDGARAMAENLEVQTTSFVGRESEIQQLAALVRQRRLVTLTGVGGVGKTRLAIQVGTDLAPGFEDGVWFVDLSSVAEDSEIAPTVAAALKLTPATADATTEILSYLASKDLMLILDNCEHVIDSAAEFVEAFLTRPTESVVLATSREQLRIHGENVMVLSPLGAQGANSAAVELFSQRALSINSSFELSDDDSLVVAELCARLDGLPLAIELAAARSAVMSPAELLAGIEDRFALLATGRRRNRTRTLEATLDWSYDLLEDDERSVLCALSAFRGDFGLDAAIDVAGVDRGLGIELIDSLIVKSLVAREVADGQSRYRLLETTALYAAERLEASDQREVVHRRHLDHYLKLGSQYPVSMWADLAAADDLRADKANIVLAVERAAAFGDWPAAAKLLASAFAVFYEYPQEGIELTHKCLLNLDGEPITIRLLTNSWWLHYMISDFAGSTALTSTLRNCDDPVGQVFGRCMFSVQVAALEGHPGASAVEQARAILATLESTPDATLGLAVCEMVSALRALYAHDAELARKHASRGFDLDAKVGFTTEVSGSIVVTKAIAELMLGRPEDALITARGTVGMHSTGLEVAALANAYLGQIDTAREICRQHAQLSIDGRVRMRATDSVLMLAVLSAGEGSEDHARELLLTMGYPRHSQLAVYAEHFAARLGISQEFAVERAAIFKDFGVEMRERSVSDIALLRDEMTRRGW